MFGLRRRLKQRIHKIGEASDQASFRNIRHASFSLSKRAKSSIIRSYRTGPPGKPPSTKAKGKHNLRGAIYVSATQESGLIGPRFSFVGDSAEVHELGGERYGAKYPERPFMLPALVESVPRFASDWAGSIGE